MALNMMVFTVLFYNLMIRDSGLRFWATHTGWPKKVSHYHESSLNHIKTRH